MRIVLDSVVDVKDQDLKRRARPLCCVSGAVNSLLETLAARRGIDFNAWPF